MHERFWCCILYWSTMHIICWNTKLSLALEPGHQVLLLSVEVDEKSLPLYFNGITFMFCPHCSSCKGHPQCGGVKGFILGLLRMLQYPWSHLCRLISPKACIMNVLPFLGCPYPVAPREPSLAGRNSGGLCAGAAGLASHTADLCRLWLSRSQDRASG